MPVVIDDPKNSGNQYKGNAGTANKLTIVMPDARKIGQVDTRRTAPGALSTSDTFDSILRTSTWGPCGSPIYRSARLAEPGRVEDDAGSPPNEIVHRFNGEVLDFGLNDPNTCVVYDIGIPSFNAFADSLVPIDEVSDPKVDPRIPSPLLMRTVLNGGTISATGSGKTWTFSSVLNKTPNGTPYADTFARLRGVDPRSPETNLMVTIRKFDGILVATIPLKPVPVPSLSDGKKEPTRHHDQDRQPVRT